MTFKSLFGKFTILSLSFVTFRVSRFHVSHLTYETFKLGLQNTLNMSKMTRVYFGVLQKILRKYKEVIAWSIEDLKGISPSICMHKILLEDNAKTSIEHQRRLNPVMKDVVRKEVLKWLNAGFIYSISDSS